MTKEKFEQKIKELGLYLEENEHFYNIKNDNCKTLQAFINKKQAGNLLIFSLEASYWNIDKQRQLGELCLEISLTPIKDR